MSKLETSGVSAFSSPAGPCRLSHSSTEVSFCTRPSFSCTTTIALAPTSSDTFLTPFAVDDDFYTCSPTPSLLQPLLFDVDLATTSPRPQTAGPSTWPTRCVGAGLTQAWKGQPSYDRLDKGKVDKVDIPQLQGGRRAPYRKDHRRYGDVPRHGKQ
ncbi:hypothetical protein B296_00028863 [Ensete ventricosum]|uniref:Uncharacterized protein n=1 Tax=Ensete ventricosum TaxID=4639 RepID=A0A427A0I8_ENSVE|nr:hypothetical protein B296_00028863 [Ensete ventricosum]